MTARFRRVAWATDVHLNFCSPEGRNAFCEAVRAHGPDALLLGGDIDEAPGLIAQLRALETSLRLPIFFVLGNHDYYRSTFDHVEGRLRALKPALVRSLTRDMLMESTSSRASFFGSFGAPGSGGRTLLSGPGNFGGGGIRPASELMSAASRSKSAT